MGPFGTAKPKLVVKTYGRDSILFGLVSPFFAALTAGKAGTPSRLESQTRAMENDANDMARQGYRIVSSREYQLPFLGILYHQVTYELIDPPRR